MSMLENQQRTQEWYNERLGRFTASEIHKLLGKQGLGKTGETYCFEKACELVFGIDEDEQFESWDMQRGKSMEPVAFEKFKELKYFEFIDVVPAYFFPYGEDAGASPDGLTSDNGNVEIKCPKSLKLFNLIANGAKEIDAVYIPQMQMQMLCGKTDHTYFFNFGIFKGVPIWHEFKVERDEKMISLIKERLPEAVEKRNKFVEELKNNKQFNLSFL